MAIAADAGIGRDSVLVAITRLKELVFCSPRIIIIGLAFLLNSTGLQLLKKSGSSLFKLLSTMLSLKHG